MELSNNDLEEYVEKLENVFSNQKNSKKNRNELDLLVEQLSNELNMSRKSENLLRNNFQKLLYSEDLDLNQKYVQHKELCCQQDSEIRTLKSILDDLRIQTKSDLETQKNEYLNKIKDIEEKWHSEVTNLKNQLESDKICHEAKERELYNDLQITQAASALEWDEKESNLRKQLTDVSATLRLSQSKIRSMQCEINQLRTQISLMKNPPEDNSCYYYQENPIQRIKQKLVEKQYQQYSEKEIFQNKNYTLQPPRPPSNVSMASTEIIDNPMGNCISTNNSENLKDLPTKESSISSAVYRKEPPRQDQSSTLSKPVQSGSNYQPLPMDNDTMLSPRNSNIGYRSDIATSDDGSTGISNLNKRSERQFVGNNQLNTGTFTPKVYKGRNQFRSKVQSVPPKSSSSTVSSVNNAVKNVKSDNIRRKRKLFDPTNTDYLSY